MLIHEQKWYLDLNMKVNMVWSAGFYIKMFSWWHVLVVYSNIYTEDCIVYVWMYMLMCVSVILKLFIYIHVHTVKSISDDLFYLLYEFGFLPKWHLSLPIDDNLVLIFKKSNILRSYNFILFIYLKSSSVILLTWISLLVNHFLQ